MRYLKVGTQRGASRRLRLLPFDPLQGPVRLLGDTRDVVHSLEQEVLLRRILDVRVDEQGVHFCVILGREGSVAVRRFEK